jgi:SAM-dependent methyltransferase
LLHEGPTYRSSLTWFGARHRLGTGALARPGTARQGGRMPTAEERLQYLLHAGDQAAWTTAALVTVLRGNGAEAHRAAAAEVLRALAVDVPEVMAGRDAGATASEAAAPVLQAAALLRGDADLWAGQSDEALLAQGRASAQGAPLMARFVFPELPGLLDAVGRPGARMLDVGTGIGALAVAYAQVFPALTVVGIDVLPRVLALARDTVAASPVADRVVLREQDVGALDEPDAYVLAWLPAPFVPEAPLRAGVVQLRTALLPGGWLVMGHGKFGGNPVDDVVGRFKTVVFGGTALDDAEAAALLTEAGFEDVRNLPTPPGAPALTVGRRPPD